MSLACFRPRPIGKALGRRGASDDDNDAPTGESLPHLPVGSNKRRMLKKVLLMLRIFHTDPMTYQF